jgi:hypothetical protein
MADPDTNPRCPTCGARGLPIVYGMPDDTLFEAAERGEVALGGCVISDHDPSLACPRGHTWGDWPAAAEDDPTLSWLVPPDTDDTR